ncbi:hypothetical protein HPB48_021634 [Haemaphysalis longicornis]|uniref:Uncharacterized protein n=1 Tax=Haemaphysalis longicornis TaxID=44386 RepID=A0A9J6GWT9_HAELO|nr:hypothetical protein HPB48_021634 [Haemaphysalis longicornis]
MKKLASLYIFVVLSLINNSATTSLNVPHCLLNDSSFLRFFSFIGRNAQLHVLASTACFEEGHSFVNRIVSYTFMPPRAFFTQLSAIGGDPYTCDWIGWVKGRFSEELCLRNAILLLCGRAAWTTHIRIPPKYITYLVVYAGTDRDAEHLANNKVLLEYSEDVNFIEAVCSKNRLVVPRNQETVRLSNSSDVFSVKEVQMSETIGGAVLPIHCAYYTTCLHPGLNVFVELLHSKNATVAIHPDDFFRLSYKHMKAFLRSLVPGSIVYNPSHEMRQNTAFRVLNPHLTVVRYLENGEFKFFVKNPADSLNLPFLFSPLTGQYG